MAEEEHPRRTLGDYIAHVVQRHFILECVILAIKGCSVNL